MTGKKRPTSPEERRHFEQGSKILPRLKVRLRLAWSAETSSTPEKWTPAKPQAGQGAVTALLVHEAIGGTIMRGEHCGETHYWILDEGRFGRIDLTEPLFGPDAEFSHVTPWSREALLASPAMQRRFASLLERLENLEPETDRAEPAPGREDLPAPRAADPRGIVRSDVFRAFNYRIDAAIEEYRGKCDLIRMICRDVAETPETSLSPLRGRIAEEMGPGQRPAMVPDFGTRLETIANLAAGLREIENRIRDYQAAKCQLVGDFDFTRGDTGYADHVFAGSEPETGGPSPVFRSSRS